MHFVVGKNGGSTRKSAPRSDSYAKLSDKVVTHFCHNPPNTLVFGLYNSSQRERGDANFAAHVVATLAGMKNYPTQVAPSGSAKFDRRKIYKLYGDRA